MSAISGSVFEISTGKPIKGASVVLSISDLAHAAEADMTDASGKYNIDNPATDDPNAILYISADGYGDATAAPGQSVGLYKTSFVQISNIPKWLWIVIAVAVLFIIYSIYLRLKHK